MINIKDMIIDVNELRFIKKENYDIRSNIKYALCIGFKNCNFENIFFVDERQRDRTFEELASILCTKEIKK